MRENWIETSLGEVCFTTSGGTPSRANKSYYTGDIPWVKSGELDRGVIYDSEEHITEEAIKNSSAKVFPKGTLLFALYGATIGKMATLGVDAATNQAICGIYKSSVFKSEYLYQYLSFQKNFLIQQGIGGAQPNISQTILKKLVIPIAPLVEQKAIVNKIEELFSSLDSGIADLKKAQEQLVIYRQAVLKKAFEGELTTQWREKQNLTFNWEKTTTGEVMPDISSGSTPKAQFLFKEGEIQFLKVYNLNFDGSLNEKKDPAFTTYEIHSTSNKRAISRAGDVLINIVGPPLGKCSMIPLNSKQEFNINQAIVRFRPNEKIMPKFLSFFLQNPETINWLEGTSKATAGQFNIKVTTCRVIPILLPTMNEQYQIVKEIESRLSVCDKVEESIKESLLKAQALRQSILKKAFEGKLLNEEEISKCKADKDYEPASVLLEKIKGEKKK